jgi:hypothetical protein
MRISNQALEDFFSDPQNAKSVHHDLFRLFRASINTHQFTENKSVYYLEKLLIFHSVINSVYQLFIDVNGKPILEFGIELQKRKALNELYLEHLQNHKWKHKKGEIEFRRVKDIIVKETIFSFYSISLEENSNHLLIYFLVPTDKGTASAFVQTILPMIRNTLLLNLNKTSQLTFPIYTNFKKHLRNCIGNYPYKGKVYGVVAHFLIEDLSLYFDYMGEQFTSQIINDVRNKIQAHLKKYDTLFTINRRSFLTFLPECDIATVEKRFKDVFFKIDPLFIRYQLDFYEVNEKNALEIDLYDHFLSSEFRNYSVTK